MSDIEVKPVTAKAVLRCDVCEKRWESRIYSPRTWGDEEKAARPAFVAGWRIYVAGRGRRTYCPEHGPSREMRLILGKERA